MKSKQRSYIGVNKNVKYTNLETLVKQELLTFRSAWVHSRLTLRSFLTFQFSVWCFEDHSVSFYFWPLYSLSFYDLRLLITPLVSTNISNFTVLKNTIRVRVLLFKVTFNNISVISWRSVSLVEETGVHGENHRPAANHNVVSNTPRYELESNSQRQC